MKSILKKPNSKINIKNIVIDEERNQMFVIPNKEDSFFSGEIEKTRIGRFCVQYKEEVSRFTISVEDVEQVSRFTISFEDTDRVGRFTISAEDTEQFGRFSVSF